MVQLVDVACDMVLLALLATAMVDMALRGGRSAPTGNTNLRYAPAGRVLVCDLAPLVLLVSCMAQKVDLV